MTYSYYAKYAQSENNTVFRHIDQNISQFLIIDKKAAIIQDFLFVDDENNDNCIIILLEMHRKLRSWWERITEKDLASDEFVHRITNRMIIKNDARDFRSTWTSISCKKKDDRIILFHLFHETQNSFIIIRRIMLSWFITIMNDHEILKNLKARSWSEIAAAHRDLMRVKTSSSRLINRYDVISYKFPVVVELIELNLLSNALVEKKKWNTSALMIERNMYLEKNVNQLTKTIKEWRIRVFRKIIIMFQHIKKTKKAIFEIKFYFQFKRESHDMFMSHISDDVDITSRSDLNEKELKFAKIEMKRTIK